MIERRVGAVSSKPGALDGLPDVIALQLYAYAHLRQPRSHPVTDAVSQGRLARRSLEIGPGAAAGRQIGVVRSNDRRLPIVVTRIENQRHRIRYPFIRSLRAQIIEHQNLGAKYRLQQL